jgi:hypothetical protein
LTYQVNQKTKITSYFDRYPKFKGHEMGALVDPDTAARRRNWRNALYYTAQAKATSTLTSRLLLEGGYSSNVEYFTGRYQPGIEKTRGTPEWYTQIGHNELVGAGTVTQFASWNGLITPANGTDPRKHVLSATMSYVTGTHSFKTGVQWGFGPYTTRSDINGDLVQRYRNGVADQVRVYNTPREAREYLNADLGVFAQDSWTIRRLTVNAGIRFEYFNGEISQQDSPPGRFAPVRHFEEQSCMPCWFDVTPRFGLSYDLFGNAKTALKATFNKYMAGQTLGYAQRYNPFQTQSDDRTWDDRNGDDVAQDNEIGPSNNNQFGLPVSSLQPGPDLRREYDLEYSAGIQHELMRGLSVNASWYRRGTYNQRRTDNILLTLDDYTLVNVVSPLNGEIIPAYNLLASKRGLVQQIDVNSTDGEKRSRNYNGFELGMAGRFGNASFFGGWTFDKIVSVQCDSVDNPNSFRFCDQRELDLPFRHEFKVSGSYRLPWEIQVNAALQSYAGPNLPTTWNIGRTTRYAANCIAPCTPGAVVIPSLTPASLSIALVPTGSAYYDRLNQLDLGVRKLFRIGRYQYSGQIDLFNFLNTDYIKSQETTWGSSLGVPLSTLQPRTLRLAMQLRF